MAAALLVVNRPVHAKKPEAAIPALPVIVAVAQQPGPDGAPQPVRDRAWVDAQLAQAERLFGVHGVRFEARAVRPLDARFARLETKDDRDALASELAPGVVNVFVVASLRDVDDPTLLRMGVHWRKRKALSKHYVIVSSTAMPTTLAHELGHFFGNGHSQVVNNVMSYQRTDDSAVFFDELQARKIRSFARIYLRTRELVPAPAAPAS
jgi:hypothetical protein